MASPTQWTWVWASSGSWWWTGTPGVLQSMSLQSDMTERMNWLTDTGSTFNIDVSTNSRLMTIQVFSKMIHVFSKMFIISSKSTVAELLAFIFLLMMGSRRSNLVLWYGSKFFQALPTAQFQGYFHSCRYFLRQHPTLDTKICVSQGSIRETDQ